MFGLAWGLWTNVVFVSCCREPAHVQWAVKFKTMIQSLHAYVKAHHTTGLAWGNKVSLPQYHATPFFSGA